MAPSAARIAVAAAFAGLLLVTFAGPAAGQERNVTLDPLSRGSPLCAPSLGRIDSWLVWSLPCTSASSNGAPLQIWCWRGGYRMCLAPRNANDQCVWRDAFSGPARRKAARGLPLADDGGLEFLPAEDGEGWEASPDAPPARLLERQAPLTWPELRGTSCPPGAARASDRLLATIDWTKRVAGLNGTCGASWGAALFPNVYSPCDTRWDIFCSRAGKLSVRALRRPASQCRSTTARRRTTTRRGTSVAPATATTAAPATTGLPAEPTVGPGGTCTPAKSLVDNKLQYALGQSCDPADPYRWTNESFCLSTTRRILCNPSTGNKIQALPCPAATPFCRWGPPDRDNRNMPIFSTDCVADASLACSSYSKPPPGTCSPDQSSKLLQDCELRTAPEYCISPRSILLCDWDGKYRFSSCGDTFSDEVTSVCYNFQFDGNETFTRDICTFVGKTYTACSMNRDWSTCPLSGAGRVSRRGAGGGTAETIPAGLAGMDSAAAESFMASEFPPAFRASLGPQSDFPPAGLPARALLPRQETKRIDVSGRWRSTVPGFVHVLTQSATGYVTSRLKDPWSCTVDGWKRGAVAGGILAEVIWFGQMDAVPLASGDLPIRGTHNWCLVITDDHTGKKEKRLIPAAFVAVLDGATRRFIDGLSQNPETKQWFPTVKIGRWCAPGTRLSGMAWAQEFPASRNTADLEEPFKGGAERFIGAMGRAGVTVRVINTYRPPQKSYLMRFSWMIANGHMQVEDVPEYVLPPTVKDTPQNNLPVEICWVHTNGPSPDGSSGVDRATSVRAATELLQAMGVDPGLRDAPGLPSIHNRGHAIDMTTTWTSADIAIDLAAPDARGRRNRTIASAPKNGMNADLWAVGAGYGVQHYFGGLRDKNHWSINGR
ncbi:hypothetical protein DFJ74DRAFT_697756 [Hyaloraphidium curvatum]|nr:hypothetical protein DFJ74DRAFT_697756 [Hyaloraphidium curvatum]